MILLNKFISKKPCNVLYFDMDGDTMEYIIGDYCIACTLQLNCMFLYNSDRYNIEINDDVIFISRKNITIDIRRCDCEYIIAGDARRITIRNIESCGACDNTTNFNRFHVEDTTNREVYLRSAPGARPVKI